MEDSEIFNEVNDVEAAQSDEAAETATGAKPAAVAKLSKSFKLTKKEIWRDVLKKYLIITLGCLLYSIGISLFVEHAQLSAGGMTGVSIIVHHYVPQIAQGYWLIIFNVPMLILGLVFFGWRFLVSTGYATVGSSLLMRLWTFIFAEKYDLISRFPSDPFINSVVGGALFGAGMGLIFRMGASTAGTDVIVKLLRRKFRYLKTGAISFVTDMIVVTGSLLINPNLETLFYTAFTVVVFTVVFDWVLYGGNSAKTVFIITSPERHPNIAQRILKEVDTGATILNATGAYSNEGKIILMCVVKPFLYPRLRDVVKEEDKNAFLVVFSAKEIYGQGYKNQDSEEL